MEAPPSTGRMTPLMIAAASELRNTAARPISSGFPKRAIGVRQFGRGMGWL